MLQGRYNFTTVMHWYTHDYPLIYSAALKQANQSKHYEEIEKLAMFIEQFDPIDLKLAVVGYNAHTDMAFELEVQFQRTHGTSHRTVGLFVASMKVSGFPAMYFVWGFLYLCCLLGLIVRYAYGVRDRMAFYEKFQRVKSDYAWKRFQSRAEGDELVCAKPKRCCTACIGHC